MRSILLLLGVLSLAFGTCDPTSGLCDPGTDWNNLDQKFFVKKHTPAQREEDVLLDNAITVVFNDVVPSSVDKSDFFVLMNQSSGHKTFYPKSCIQQPDFYTLIFDTVKCFGAPLEPNMPYVFYISQKIEGNEIVTLSSIRGIPVEAKAFMQEESSLYFRTTTDIPADVVPTMCSPALGAVDVELQPVIMIAFDNQVHMGTGTISIMSTNFPSSSIILDVTDAKRVEISPDGTTLIVRPGRLNGRDTYHVVFPRGVVLSPSGSGCGTIDGYFFSTQEDTESPYVVSIMPTNYQQNLPKNTVVRITFSENVIPAAGQIHFKSSNAEDIKVNVVSATEVKCKHHVCSINPEGGFNIGTYDMAFDKTAFQDTNENKLMDGVSSHVLTFSGTECGLDYVKVGSEEKCVCVSMDDMCKCQCGDSFFVKPMTK